MEILRTKDGKYALKTPLALRSRTFLPCNHFQNPHSCHLTTRRIFYLCSQLQYPHRFHFATPRVFLPYSQLQYPHRFHFATQRVFLPYSQLQLPQLFPLTAPHIYLLSIQLQHPRRCRLGSLRISLLFIQAECPQMVYSRNVVFTIHVALSSLVSWLHFFFFVHSFKRLQKAILNVGVGPYVLFVFDFHEGRPPTSQNSALVAVNEKEDFLSQAILNYF